MKQHNPGASSQDSCSGRELLLMHTEKFTNTATLVHSDLDLEGWDGIWEFQGVHHFNIGVGLLFSPSAVQVINLMS